MIRRENAAYPNKLSSSELGKIREIVGHFLSKHPSKYLSDAEVEREIRSRLHEKATPERAQQAIDFAIENYHYEIKRYESEGGRKRNPPMLILGNPPSEREPYPYSSPHGIGSWSPPLPLGKPDVKSLKPRFDPLDPSWEKRRERVSASLAAYLMPFLKSIKTAAIYNPAEETVYIHRGFKGVGGGKWNMLDEEVESAFAHANKELKFARQYEPKKVSERAWKYSREPVRVNRGGSMRGRNPKVQPPGSGKRFWPRLPAIPDDEPDADLEVARKVGWLPVWTEDQEAELDDDGKPLPIDPGPMRAVVRKLDDNGQYYDIDDDGNVWVYVGQQKDSTGGERAWKKRLNDIYHALGQPLRFPDVEPGGSQTRGRMMNPPLGELIPASAMPSVMRVLKKHGGKPSLHRELVAVLEPHHAELERKGVLVDYLAYAIEYAAGRQTNPLSGCEREFARGHVEAHREDIDRFSNPRGGPGNEDDARELELYIDNDEGIYTRRFIPIVKNLMKKRRKGVYDHALSVKLWMYLVDDAARAYIREFGSEGDYVFTKPTRLLVAERYATSFEQDAAAGEYDHLLVEPKRPGTKVHAEAFPLDDFYTDLGMHEKDYRYKVAPRSGSFDPLYAKDTHQVAEIMRMYPNELFNVFDMKEKRKENRGRRGR